MSSWADCCELIRFWVSARENSWEGAKTRAYYFNCSFYCSSENSYTNAEMRNMHFLSDEDETSDKEVSVIDELMG